MTDIHEKLLMSYKDADSKMTKHLAKICLNQTFDGLTENPENLKSDIMSFSQVSAAAQNHGFIIREAECAFWLGYIAGAYSIAEKMLKQQGENAKFSKNLGNIKHAISVMKVIMDSSSHSRTSMDLWELLPHIDCDELYETMQKLISVGAVQMQTIGKGIVKYFATNEFVAFVNAQKDGDAE